MWLGEAKSSRGLQTLILIDEDTEIGRFWNDFHLWTNSYNSLINQFKFSIWSWFIHRQILMDASFRCFSTFEKPKDNVFNDIFRLRIDREEKMQTHLTIWFWNSANRPNMAVAFLCTFHRLLKDQCKYYRGHSINNQKQSCLLTYTFIWELYPKLIYLHKIYRLS